MHAASDPGHALLKYNASNANAVLGVLHQNPARIQVELGGRPVGKDQAGSEFHGALRGVT